MKRKLFGITGAAAVLMALMVQAGCPTDTGNTKNTGKPGSTYSIAVTSDPDARTLSLTISGTEWGPSSEDKAEWIVPRCFTEVGTGDFSDYNGYNIGHNGLLESTGSISADKKTITFTLSKKSDYSYTGKTGTVTFTPLTSVSGDSDAVSEFLWWYASGFGSPPDIDDIPITGPAVTFTFE